MISETENLQTYILSIYVNKHVNLQSIFPRKSKPLIWGGSNLNEINQKFVKIRTENLY
jgi:hypothetical protein